MYWIRPHNNNNNNNKEKTIINTFCNYILSEPQTKNNLSDVDVDWISALEYITKCIVKQQK